jgi:hypothetical protein
MTGHLHALSFGRLVNSRHGFHYQSRYFQHSLFSIHPSPLQIGSLHQQIDILKGQLSSSQAEALQRESGLQASLSDLQDQLASRERMLGDAQEAQSLAEQAMEEMKDMVRQLSKQVRAQGMGQQLQSFFDEGRHASLTSP